MKRPITFSHRNLWLMPRLLMSVYFTSSAISFNAGAQCTDPTPSCYVQYKATSAADTKCAFGEFIQTMPPRLKIYKYRVENETEQYSFTYQGTAGCYESSSSEGCDHYHQATDGPFSGDQSYNLNWTRTDDYTGPHCGYTLTCNGWDTFTEHVNDARTHTWWGSQDCTPCGLNTRTNYSSSTLNSASIEYINYNGAYQWVRIENDETSGTSSWGDNCTPFGTYPWDNSSSSTNPFTWGVSASNVTSTRQFSDLSFTDSAIICGLSQPLQFNHEKQDTVTLSTEYTDEELWADILSLMPAYGSYWYTPTGDPDDAFSWIAYSVIDGDHVWARNWEEGQLPTLQKLLYRFAIPASKKALTYTITWDIITWDVPSGDVTTRSHSLAIGGTGEDPLYTPAQEELPPFWDDSLDFFGGYVVSWVDNVRITSQAKQTSSVVAAGPFPSTGTSGCSTCGSSSSSTPGLGDSGGVFAQFGLGRIAGGAYAGALLVSSGQMTPALATPAMLTCSATDSQVVVITNGTQIRQVMAPEGFADVITDDQFTYEVRFYLPSQVSNQTNSSGLYTLIGSPTPFVTWTVQNPDASTNIYNRLTITETRGSDVKVYNWTFTAATKTWVLDYPGNLREDTIVVSVVTNNDGGYTKTVTTTVGLPNGPLSFKSKKIYQKLGGVLDGGSELLLQEILSPDSNPQITTYTYVPGLRATGTFRPLQMVVHPDGSWQYYVYNTYQDGIGLHLLTDVYSGFGDQPPPGSAGPSDLTSRHTQYVYYSPFSQYDDSTVQPFTPRSTTDFVQGQVVSLRYFAARSGETRDIRCQRATAWADDIDNLLTINTFYTSGPNIDQLERVQNPDGTVSIYQYGQATDNSETNTIWTGVPSTDLSTVVDGSEELTILGPVGQPYSVTRNDVLSSAVLSQDVYGNFGAFNRPQQVTHLDGTTELTQYTCCGVDNTTDRDGVQTFFGYDALKRQISSTRLNITSTSVLDPVGRTLQTIRTGSDNSQILMHQAQYDLAGRTTSETNALGGVTSYSESADPVTGALVRTTIYPDNGTRVEAYYLDGSMKQVSGTAVHTVQYSYGVDADGPYTTEIKVTTTGGTNEWVKTSSDLLGHPFKTLYPDGASEISAYNNAGQLISQTDPDQVTTLYQYNLKGELAYTAIDTNQNGIIDFDGSDRITSTISDVVADHGVNVRRTRTYVWDTLNANSSNLVSVSEVSADGLQSWQTTYRDPSTSVTSSSHTLYSAGGNRYVTNTAPDNSYVVSTYSYGRLVSTVRKDASNAQLSSVSFSYDPHGRQNVVTDARNGATTTTFNNADLVFTVTTPNPGTPGGTAQTTTTYYNKMLQATNVVNPDATSVTNIYLTTGELQQTSGSRTYPVAYTYDYAGRMKTMQTWTNFSANSGAAVTTWNYDQYRGFLTGKLYADNHGPNYTYTPAGRLKTRAWARGISTSYFYDSEGALSSVAYSDSTPGTTWAFDRLGRQSAIVQNGMTTSLAYNLAGQVLSESYSGGSLGTLAVTNGYDTFMRRNNLTALASNNPFVTEAFGYDAGGRLQTATDNSHATAYSATYTYVANSPLVLQISYKAGSITRMTMTNQFDYLNRLTRKSSLPSGASAVSFNYVYNSANQRTYVTNADGSFWAWTYDNLGQVQSGKKYWSDGTPVAGQQFAYGFDDIGNRRTASRGGDQSGANLRQASYTVNNLNELNQRTVPGYVDVMGSAASNANVMVKTTFSYQNWYGMAYRKGNYFRAESTVDTSGIGAWLSINSIAVLPGGANPDTQSNVVGNVFVPKTPELFVYDLDGNLTSDGRWNYTWNAENRLVKMAVNTPIGPQLSLQFEYDSKGRRIRKQVWQNTTWTGTPSADLRFVYDGWNLISSLNQQLSPLNSFLWGLDLSGGIQGAGGVGGLLSEWDSSTINNQPSAHFAAFDGNGNVAALVNAADGTISAQYEYGPFGEVIRATGPMAKSNPFRFSTKYQDAETDQLYYGYRYYSASTGRWLSRDLIEELDSPCPYLIVGNETVSKLDYVGLYTLSFNVVHGRPVTGKTVGAGEWSQPFWAGSGWSSKGSSFAASFVDLDNSFSWWEYSWPYRFNWYCTTVWPNGGGIGSADDAGSIQVFLSDCTGGQFRVRGEYHTRLTGEGPRKPGTAIAIYAQAWLHKGEKTGPVIWYARSSDARPYRDLKEKFEVVVNVPPSGKVQVVTHQPQIAFFHRKYYIDGKPSYGSIFAAISVESVESLGH